jgi:valyl-tRNA synthetase
VLPRVECKKCGKPFATQWASKPEDVALPRAAVVSERFELGRNFCNKLWNASRFALLNLEGYSPGPVAEEELAVEDRWLLSRLATVTKTVTAALGDYRYSDAAKALYDFAWNEFCSFYVEMVKGRLQEPASRVPAQRVLTHALDTLLRLLHPMIPFITEEVWQLLGQAARERGLSDSKPAAESIMIAPWPEADAARQDEQIEARFARFQDVLGGLREVRSRQNIPPKTPLKFRMRCDAATADLLRPMEPYFEAMAGAKATAWGAEVQPPAESTNFVVPAGEVFVDLAGHIDVKAEIARHTKELARLESAIAGKRRQLSNASFVERAPAEVIQKERTALEKLEGLLAATESALAALRAAKK